MILKYLMVSVAIALMIMVSAVVWDTNVATKMWSTTNGGNIECNKSIIKSECRMISDEDLTGMYKGLKSVKE